MSYSTADSFRPVTLDDVRGAQKMLSGVARMTAMEGSRHLTQLVGSPVHLKCENLQRTGSFKLRGAYVRIAGLLPEERAAGVVAASAGNHAQGVALASALLGVHATVFMPQGAPLPKISATREYGAEVRLHGQVVDETLTAAQEYADETGAVLIHPFDHPDVIAGQGTVGLEILEQCPEVRTIVVGIGGGGLAAGIAVAVKALRPDVRIVGVQASGAAAYPPSLAAGRPVSVRGPLTMADGIRVGRPGDVPFAIVRDLVDEVRTVSEDALSAALLLCLERAKLVVEPAGASPVAALLSEPGAFEGPVVAVLSGGNVDPVLMQRVLRHGMAAQGRYLAVRLRLTDRPGALATLLGVLSEADANVLDISHVRTDPRLGLAEAEVELHLETKGPAHCTEVGQALRAAGYTVID
ncbi:threonine ammonia-lyase [Streptomyces acidiscabies]|uniref:L-threonine dehydratase catabolic TdcB n=3 Tax=Streptomyces acidiscabies TaxID=42234 RepID=A0AAP6BKE4_9ACTN|nr:threonine ammonia-lyase [Streptomyces acidiscabies]MBP5937285.1 threonine ammonia-lyase [Streptomyces sp. LBUM 1476]MBZ3914654.1 threonine ammonia-lyase [Streptomyces acidiscabies]MDX2966205.1 threonine ammonia-lyase [Streptomyces acidiscabies]MDX3025526.1 threonine ammonia-lyase [Streptomyces acidiscabies]MDX3796197.1 threonine ammonia-lyase [Streptomyces acidiscabies]